MALSPGETQRRRLEVAQQGKADLLLLDEPTHDLDRDGIEWLLHWLDEWPRALVVVSHHRPLLRRFHDFFLVAETGCRHFHGDFDALVEDMRRRADRAEKRYVQNLHRLVDRERRHDTVSRRRQRKKNLGRIHELGRCPSRAKLNGKRSYAQESQGKRGVLQRARIEAARDWAKAARRALAVDLPLTLPDSPEPSGTDVVTLHEVGVRVDSRTVVEGVDLRLGRQRLAIVGRNGSGKSTLVETLVGNRRPDEGTVRGRWDRVAYVAQNSANWSLEESLVEHLVAIGIELDEVARLVRAHRFPLALAERPLSSLSPGERLRAALICLSRRNPVPELLILDEPTHHLDFEGVAALEAFLKRWPGGLVVVSHDDEFLAAIGVDHRLDVASLGRTTCGPTIRSFRSEDLVRLQEIRHAAFAPVFDSFRRLVGEELYALALADSDTGQAQLLDEICGAGSDAHVLVAVRGTRVVGFVSYTVHAFTRVGEIGLNAVDPADAGDGIGTRLYESALEAMKELGAQVATVSTGGDPSHAPARRAYEKVGFQASLPSLWFCRKL